MSEEERAAGYRRMMTARTAWEYNRRFTAHQSDRPAMLAFRDRWRPVLDKTVDWDPVDEGYLEAGRGLQIP
jgi:hypothetical protein